MMTMTIMMIPTELVFALDLASGFRVAREIDSLHHWAF